MKINPNHVSALNNLGIIFNELKEYQKSKKIYEKILDSDPNYAHAYNNLGSLFKVSGEYQKAKNSCINIAA